jgi:hypothetical protein
MVPVRPESPGWDKPGPVAPVDVSAAELSSMSTAMDELARRVTAMAEGLANTPADWVAQELFAVERSLGAAGRRLAALNDRLRKGA